MLAVISFDGFHRVVSSTQSYFVNPLKVVSDYLTIPNTSKSTSLAPVYTVPHPLFHCINLENFQCGARCLYLPLTLYIIWALGIEIG